MNNQQLRQKYMDGFARLNKTGRSTHDKGKKLAIYLEEMITEIGNFLNYFI